MRKKILIIEDDQFVRENTAEILQLANYEVLTAENGRMGLDKARFFKPDLIICDILMPVLDGYGVLQIISRNKELQKIPLIFMSAKTNHEDVRKGMDLGASDYITKPFEESELLSAVASRLRRKAMWESYGQQDIFLDEDQRTEDLESFVHSHDKLLYKKGATVFCEGNSSQFIFYILDGEIKTSKTNREGKELITDILSDGRFFGFTSLLMNRPYSEDAIAVKDSTLIRIPRQDIYKLVKSDPQLALNFIDILSSDLEVLKNHLLHVAYDSVRKKTADALLELSEKSVESSVVMISRSDLAGVIGIAKETLTRTLTDFKKEGLINPHRDRIELLALQDLQQIQ